MEKGELFRCCFLYRVDTGDNDVQVCSSASFSTNGTSYQNVCGIARGYQKGITTAFYYSTFPSSSIESPYVVGLSITYGNPRQHIYGHMLLEDNTIEYPTQIDPIQF